MYKPAKLPKYKTWFEDYTRDKTLDQKLDILVSGMSFNLRMGKLGFYDFALYQQQLDIYKKLLRQKFPPKPIRSWR